MPKVTKVEKARKDYPSQGIKKGDSYYWWKFRYDSIKKSKTYPKPQQLTQSVFMMSVYDLQDEISNITGKTGEEIKSQLDSIKDAVQNLLEETQDSLNYMPEQLQESSILTERVEGLESYISDLDNVDISIKDCESSAKEESVENQIQAIVEEIQSIELYL